MHAIYIPQMSRGLYLVDKTDNNKFPFYCFVTFTIYCLPHFCDLVPN